MSKPVVAVITAMIAATLSGLVVWVYVEGSTRGARDQCLAELSTGKGVATALRAEATTLRTENDRLNASLASLNNQRDAIATELAQRAGEIETLAAERAQQAREIETLVAKAESDVTDREQTTTPEDHRSVGLNDLTIKAFQAKREQQPKGFWVKAELTEKYFLTKFNDSRLYQSVNLWETTKDGHDLYYGYLRRSDSTCRAFIEYLSRGEQPMTVLLEPDYGLGGDFLILEWTPGFVNLDDAAQRR